MYAYKNGVLKKLDEVHVSLKDYGFSRGLSVYELTRVYGHQPFRLDDHLDRLYKSLSICGIAPPINREVVAKQIVHLISLNNFPQSVATIHVTQGAPGALGFGLGVTKDDLPQMYVYVTPVKPFSSIYPLNEVYYKEGVKVKCVDLQRPYPSAKTTNYSAAVIASSHHRQKGFDDIAYVEKEGYITEASRANLFFIRDGALVTPKRNMLEGITRKVVLEIAEENSIPYSLEDVYVHDLGCFSECFMTGSHSELVPIVRMDDVHYSRNDFTLYQFFWDAYKQKINRL